MEIMSSIGFAVGATSTFLYAEYIGPQTFGWVIGVWILPVFMVVFRVMRAIIGELT